MEAPSADTDAFSDALLPAEPAAATAGRARRLALGSCCTAVAAVVVAGAYGRGPLGGVRAPLAVARLERAFPVLADNWHDLAVELAEKGAGQAPGDGGGAEIASVTAPSSAPSSAPTPSPTSAPSGAPTAAPSRSPTSAPTGHEPNASGNSSGDAVVPEVYEPNASNSSSGDAAVPKVYEPNASSNGSYGLVVPNASSSGDEAYEPNAAAAAFYGDDGLVEFPETGCGNWRKLAITEAITFKDRQGCAKACQNQAGCVKANFQLRHPGVDGSDQLPECATNWAITRGSCYLFGTSADIDCDKSYNPCWLLLEPRADTLTPATYSLTELGTGCSNWHHAKVGEPLDMWNHHMCAKECQYTEGCKMFNFQQRGCTHDEMKECGEQVGYDYSGAFRPAGRCILLSGCDQESNQYWDLYAMSD